jgi:hypothetical protein
VHRERERERERERQKRNMGTHCLSSKRLGEQVFYWQSKGLFTGQVSIESNVSKQEDKGIKL